MAVSSHCSSTEALVLDVIVCTAAAVVVVVIVDETVAVVLDVSTVAEVEVLQLLPQLGSLLLLLLLPVGDNKSW